MFGWPPSGTEIVRIFCERFFGRGRSVTIAMLSHEWLHPDVPHHPHRITLEARLLVGCCLSDVKKSTIVHCSSILCSKMQRDFSKSMITVHCLASYRMGRYERKNGLLQTLVKMKHLSICEWFMQNCSKAVGGKLWRQCRACSLGRIQLAACFFIVGQFNVSYHCPPFEYDKQVVEKK